MIELIKSLPEFDRDQVFYFWDKKVFQLYKEIFFHGPISSEHYISGQGEECKTFTEYQRAIHYLLDKKIHRQALIVAIGGGALSDLAGFVAASILRGVDWMVVPTTLLSMVDSCVGGKTAINTEHGKNLVGAFHSPRKVFLHFDFLKTLPESERQSGLGELIKTYFISAKVRMMIDKNESVEKIIPACLEFKQEITKKDFRETHERKILNLGHTFGHLYEKQYRLPHGLAVLLGLKHEFELFNGPTLKLEQLLNHFDINLPAISPQDLDLINLSNDKKRVGQQKIELLTIDQKFQTIPRSLQL
jgi:3-dehydroquinate synthase